MDDVSAALNAVTQRPDIRLILDRLVNDGHRAMLVGGAVRDGLLGHPPEDVDILTDATAVTVGQLFRDQRTRLVGVSFPVTLVNGVEVATTRTDADFPASDLGRRDLTLNAMAWDPVTRSLVDPFGGQQDLKARVIRFTGDPKDRIAEDPIRMVRACRFAARLGGTIEPASFAAICEHHAWITQRAAGDRCRMEVIKAMAMAKPSVFFTLLYDSGLLSHIFPSLARCHDLDGGPHHGETVFEHCLLVGDALPARRPMLRLAGYLHDTGKFDTAVIKEGKLTFAGHEKCWDAMEKDLVALRFSNKDIDYIRAMFKGHMRPLYPDSTPRAVRRLMAMLDELGLTHDDFLRMRIADRKGNLAKPPYTFSEIRVRLEKIMATQNQQTAFNINDLKISGTEIQNILELAQGPEIGRIKAQLFEMVLETPALNTHSKLVQQLFKIKHGKTNG